MIIQPYSYGKEWLKLYLHFHGAELGNEGHPVCGCVSQMCCWHVYVSLSRTFITNVNPTPGQTYFYIILIATLISCVEWMWSRLNSLALFLHIFTLWLIFCCHSYNIFKSLMNTVLNCINFNFLLWDLCKKKLRSLSPRVNYTDRATAALRFM
jgi:hypothetical protein